MKYLLLFLLLISCKNDYEPTTFFFDGEQEIPTEDENSGVLELNLCLRQPPTKNFNEKECGLLANQYSIFVFNDHKIIIENLEIDIDEYKNDETKFVERVCIPIPVGTWNVFVLGGGKSKENSKDVFLMGACPIVSDVAILPPSQTQTPNWTKLHIYMQKINNRFMDPGELKCNENFKLHYKIDQIQTKIIFPEIFQVSGYNDVEGIRNLQLGKNQGANSVDYYVFVDSLQYEDKELFTIEYTGPLSFFYNNDNIYELNEDFCGINWTLISKVCNNDENLDEITKEYNYELILGEGQIYIHW